VLSTCYAGARQQISGSKAGRDLCLPWNGSCEPPVPGSHLGAAGPADVSSAGVLGAAAVTPDMASSSPEAAEGLIRFFYRFNK